MTFLFVFEMRKTKISKLNTFNQIEWKYNKLFSYCLEKECLSEFKCQTKNPNLRFFFELAEFPIFFLSFDIFHFNFLSSTISTQSSNSTS